MTGVRLLLSEIYYPGSSGRMEKGFVHVSGEVISDFGSEYPAEYELSEYHVGYDYRAVLIHGLSAVVSPTLVPLGNIDREALSTLSKDDVSLLATNGLTRLLRSGITLPLIDDPYPDLVAKILIERNLPGAIFDYGGTVPHRPGITYLTVREGLIYLGDTALGSLGEMICEPGRITGRCKVIRIPARAGYLGCFFASTMNHYDVLFGGYKLTGRGSGTMMRGEPADLLIYDFRDPFKNVSIPKGPGEIVRLGYLPDTVIVNGDIIVERGEVLELNPPSVMGIIEEITAKTTG